MQIEKASNGVRRKRGPVVQEAPAPVKVTETKSAPASKAAVIFIPKIETVRTTIEVQGISPLILHAWGKKAITQMRDKQQKLATRAKEAKDPVADFNEARYIDDKGRDCIPVTTFKRAAVEAGVIAGAFKTTLRKAFFVGDGGGYLLPIQCAGGPVMREDMVRVGQGVADIRYRPEYRNWSCKIPVEFNPRIISAEQLFNLFDNAGYSVGVGEWRPERDGQFGRFRVKLS